MRTAKMRTADLLEWIKANYQPGEMGPSRNEISRQFGISRTVAGKHLERLMASREWAWRSHPYTRPTPDAPDTSQGTSWRRQMAMAVSRYEAKRGDLAAIADLVAALRDRQQATGQAVALVGGYRYRLAPWDRNDVIREQMVQMPGVSSCKARAL